MDHDKRNIALIGLMGAGKTSVGKVLSKTLDFDFVDIDEIIEQREKQIITEIFKTKGEIYFRELEVSIIKEFSLKHSQVISTGGGAPENPINIISLKENGLLFYLFATVDQLFKRLSGEMNNRPMLFTNNPKTRLKELLTRREPFYLKADHKIDTTNKSVEEISNVILKLYNGENNAIN